MNKLITATLILFLYTNILSQVGGISGSKLAAVCVDVVDHHKLEFEPAFFHFKSSSAWDNDGNLYEYAGAADSTKWVTGLGFRITYGLFDVLELGASISSDLQASSWGLRYVLTDNPRNNFAVIAGLNLPLGNKTFDSSVRLANTIASAGGGIVFSTQFNTSLSLDVNAQYFSFLENTSDGNKGSFYFASDIGYYVFSGGLQLIAGITYQHSVFQDFNVNVLTLFPGITVETGKGYIIVLSAPFDIYGTNASKNAGIALALTLTID